VSTTEIVGRYSSATLIQFQALELRCGGPADRRNPERDDPLRDYNEQPEPGLPLDSPSGLSSDWVNLAGGSRSGCSLALTMECALRVEEHITIPAGRRHQPSSWSDAYQARPIPLDQRFGGSVVFPTSAPSGFPSTSFTQISTPSSWYTCKSPDIKWCAGVERQTEPQGMPTLLSGEVRSRSRSSNEWAFERENSKPRGTIAVWRPNVVLRSRPRI
jgi:hypothetical protein